MNLRRNAPRILLLLVTLAIAGCAISILPESAHAATPPTSLDLSHVSKADIIATVEHLQRNEHDALAKLGQAQVDLASSQAETKAVQKAADDLKGDRDRLLQENGDLWKKIIKQNQIIAKKDHKLDLLGWALALAAAGLIFELSGRLGGILADAPQLLAGRIIAAVITFGAVFAWVRYF